MIRGTTLATEQIRKDYESPHANLDRAGRTEIGILLAEIDALHADLNAERELRVATTRALDVARRATRVIADKQPIEDRIWALIEEFEKQRPFTGEDEGSNDRALLFNLISQHFTPKG